MTTHKLYRDHIHHKFMQNFDLHLLCSRSPWFENQANPVLNNKIFPNDFQMIFTQIKFNFAIETVYNCKILNI